MLIRSARLRMTLYFLLGSGLVLVGIIIFFQFTIYRFGLQQVDTQIKTLGEGQLSMYHPPGHWVEFDQSLNFIFGAADSQKIAVMAVDRSGRTLFKSVTWPDALPPALTKSIAVPKGTRPPPDFPRIFEQITRWKTLLNNKKNRPHHPPEIPPPFRVKPSLYPPRFYTVQSNDNHWRLGILYNEQTALAIAFNLEAFRKESTHSLLLSLIAAPAALLLLGIGGLIMSRKAIKPVQMITEIAAGITAQDLQKRIPTHQVDQEFLELIGVMNTMLKRLECSFHQATRFSADAAHELKTPLTILQGELEHAMRSAPDGSSHQMLFNNLLEEVQRLTIIMRKLLLLSRIDAGQLQLTCQPVNISQLLIDAAEDIDAMAPHLRLSTDIAPDITLPADPILLNQLILNLTSNAIKYNLPNGWIDLHLQQQETAIHLTISNACTPLNEHTRTHLFDRFFRGDPSHNRKTDGSGLGLSLAREIARAHRGTLTPTFSGPESISFLLSLPRPSSRTA